MTESDFLAAVQANPANAAILSRLPALGLPDAWLVSGALFQTVWNVLDGQDPARGIRDYDLFYFDPDTSWEAEDAAIRRCAAVFAPLGIPVELRNQARTHLWYESRFGAPYPPLGCATEGIDRFLQPCAQVGVQPHACGVRLYAPAGLDDIAAMIVRPNRTANFRAEHYEAKAARWQALWPRLTVLPAYT